MPPEKDHEAKQPFTEFTEIVQDFHHVQNRKEPLFTALFIDGKPRWRKARYQILLEQLEIENHGDAKKSYNSFLEALREDLKSDSYRRSLQRYYAEDLQDQEIVSRLHKIVEKLFTQIEMHSFCKGVVRLMQRAGKAPNSYDLVSRLQNTRISIENAPHLIKLPIASILTQFIKGQINFHYDPYLQENTPYHLFDYDDGERKTPIIRMGTPTYEGYFASFTDEAKINHEFEAFLESYQIQGKKHLYINLQNRIPGWIGWNEAPRCKALEELNNRFPDAITLITLSKNSSFYHQSGEYQYLEDAEDFKNIFLDQLLSKDTGFYFESIPELVEDDEIFTEIIDDVHVNHFGNRDRLHKDERLGFIELVYLYIEKWCIQNLEPDTINISCKDGIDRAGGANALLYYDIYMKEEVKEEEVDNLEAILFAPALLVKKRPITENRFLRFINALRYL